MDTPFHKPVLVDEVIAGLVLKKNGVYLDVTMGGGGHTRAILDAEPTCRVLALEWDRDTVEEIAPQLEEQYGNRITVVWSSFVHLYKVLKKHKIKSVDGILADFGISQHQIFHAEGFSFYHDSPLDMRTSKAHQKLTASEIVNTYHPKDIAQILFRYGEERHGNLIAKRIIEHRKKQPIATTRQLAEIIERIPACKSPKSSTHPATKTFQALRLYINKELENITAFLPAAVAALKPEGRLACITFHSLEDRLVKRFFRENNDKLRIITTKPIIPSPDEVATNPAARSAKLRVAEKLTL